MKDKKLVYCVYLISSTKTDNNTGSFKHKLHYKEVLTKDLMKKFSIEKGSLTDEITPLGAYRNMYTVSVVIDRHSKHYEGHAVFNG